MSLPTATLVSRNLSLKSGRDDFHVVPKFHLRSGVLLYSDYRSHAGSVTFGTRRERFPAWAAATGWARSLQNKVQENRQPDEEKPALDGNHDAGRLRFDVAGSEVTGDAADLFRKPDERQWQQ